MLLLLLILLLSLLLIIIVVEGKVKVIKKERECVRSCLRVAL